MAVENEADKNNEVIEILLNELGVRRSTTTESWDVEEDSLRNAERAHFALGRLVARDPGKLPEVINGLVKKAEYFESIKYIEDKSERWVDAALSLKILTSVVLGIGEPALPLLSGKKEKTAKSLARKLRNEIRTEKIRKFFGGQ
ncbi:MAG: hypothetical protein ABSE04_02550 [Candidatus Microgenomates bacterium]|jgi:hypothetical protein